MKLPSNRIAAIVVNYRTPELTIACVDSVLGSTGVRPHVVVVDNASGDDSVARLQARFKDNPAVTLLVRDRNDGYAGGNNAGVVVAREKGATLAFVLNSDTVVDAACLSRLTEHADADRTLALLTPRIVFGDHPDLLWFGGSRFSLWTGRPIHVGFRKSADHGWSEAGALPFASGCALLVRLDAVPGRLFDDTLFSYAEDLDLSLRLRKRGFGILYVPDARVLHFEGASHRRAGGQALRFYLNTRNLIRVVARHARWYHWITLGPMLVVDVVARFCAVAVRDRDPRAFGAVLRGALHAVTGGRHAIEAG